jgi:hypothetical protein
METLKAPVMLIEVLDTHGRCHSQHRIVNVGASCKIGRSLSCDIVLDDAHAAPEHASLTLLEDGRISVADLDSRNGTRVAAHHLCAAATVVEDGRLIVGRTHVRVRTLHSALPPEKLFRRDIVQRHKTLLAMVGIALSLGYVAFNEWQEAPDQMARDIFLAVLIGLMIIGAWIGLWALITRVSHGAWALRTHLAIVANGAALVLWSSVVFDIAAFATQWEWLATLLRVVAVGVILGALYLHLRNATHMAARVAVIVAVAIPLALGGTAAWIAWQGASRNVNRLELGTNVYPPQVRIAPARELNDYLTHANELKGEANRNRQTSLAEMPIAETRK